MGRLDSADMGRLDSDRVDGLDSDNVDGLDRKYFLLCLVALLTIFVILFIYNITRETDQNFELLLIIPRNNDKTLHRIPV